MVQSAEDLSADDRIESLDRSMDRRILAQREMRPDFVVAAETLGPDEDAAVRKRFADDRGHENDELAEHTRAFLEELKRETALEKFTFAELEEVEDFQKLETWLGKVRPRDFFPVERLERATADVERCRTALAQFAAEVYLREGVTDGSDG